MKNVKLKVKNYCQILNKQDSTSILNLGWNSFLGRVS